MQRLSIVIPNYNYGHFIGDAVNSALSVQWPDVEVIVVDDGSTDDSLEVLTQFGDRIRTIVQENSGPRVACNRGFAASSGDAVIFLDADDVLESSIASEVSKVWRRGVSKVQVQMQRIDRDGRRYGRPFPCYRSTPTPEQIRYWMTTTSAYPTPPGSGNVYARDFLVQLFPLDDRCGDATDSACLAAAPFLGDVITIPHPLVHYRVHGGNRSSLRADPTRLAHQIERARQRDTYARQISGRTEVVDSNRALVPLRRGRHLLQMRVAAYRLKAEAHPISGDGRRRLLWDAVTGTIAPGPESMLHRLAVLLWCMTALVAPRSAVQKLVNWRFA